MGGLNKALGKFLQNFQKLDKNMSENEIPEQELVNAF